MKTDPSILIVEDEPRMRDLLVRALETWGFSATSARSGEEALRLMEARPSHIVLLDLNLPGIGGLEALQRMRANWPDVQAIVLTGFGDLPSAKQAVHLDVVEFLTKPCHLGELEQAIDKAIRRLADKPGARAPDIALPPRPTTPDDSHAATLAQFERQHILDALAKNNGNRSATATQLGISLRTLYYRLNEYENQGYDID
jgi:DNA-binding NtrC family response regulator